MIGDTYLIDANVPLYAVGQPGPLKEPCEKIMAAMASGALPAVLDVIVIQEVLHHCARSRRLELGVAVVTALTNGTTDILPFTADDMGSVCDIMRERPGLQVHDAVHLAIMQRYGLTHIITADRHFATVPGITALDPAAAAALLR